MESKTSGARVWNVGERSGSVYLSHLEHEPPRLEEVSSREEPMRAEAKATLENDAKLLKGFGVHGDLEREEPMRAEAKATLENDAKLLKGFRVHRDLERALGELEMKHRELQISKFVAAEESERSTRTTERFRDQLQQTREDLELSKRREQLAQQKIESLLENLERKGREMRELFVAQSDLERGRKRAEEEVDEWKVKCLQLMDENSDIKKKLKSIGGESTVQVIENSNEDADEDDGMPIGTPKIRRLSEAQIMLGMVQPPQSCHNLNQHRWDSNQMFKPQPLPVQGGSQGQDSSSQVSTPVRQQPAQPSVSVPSAPVFTFGFQSQTMTSNAAQSAQPTSGILNFQGPAPLMHPFPHQLYQQVSRAIGFQQSSEPQTIVPQAFHFGENATSSFPQGQLILPSTQLLPNQHYQALSSKPCHSGMKRKTSSSSPQTKTDGIVSQKNNKTQWCSLCKVTISSIPLILEQHRVGKKHAAHLRKLQQEQHRVETEHTAHLRRLQQELGDKPDVDE